MLIISIIAGLILLYIFLRIPQWLANKTGKIVKVRGTFSTLATYEPKGKLKRQMGILQHPLQMSIEHEIEYIKTGNKRIQKEYEKLSVSDRRKIEIAVKSHPNITQNEHYSHISEDQYITFGGWLNDYEFLNLKVISINYKSFYTLTKDEKNLIQNFIILYADTTSILRKNNFQYYKYHL